MPDHMDLMLAAGLTALAGLAYTVLALHGMADTAQVFRDAVGVGIGAVAGIATHPPTTAAVAPVVVPAPAA